MTKMKPAATTEPATAANALSEGHFHDNHDPAYLQALRLLVTGKVSPETTFGEMDEILARDTQETAILCHIDEWFSLYDPDTATPAEIRTALRLIRLHIFLAPEDFD